MKLRGEKAGFTIIELLTVMSIIVILISIMVPALNKVRRFAKIVGQKGQFHEISKGMELYRNEHEETYPDSGAFDLTNPAIGYCGAMKLCEAMLGQDGMGFHPDSRFAANGLNSAGIPLYLFSLCIPTSPDLIASTPVLSANLRERKKYLDTENIRAVRLQDMYTWSVSNGSSYTGIRLNGDPVQYPNAVISDVFLHAQIKSLSCPLQAGVKVGMPVLYYKADPSKLSHDANDLVINNNINNIYNVDDNWAITALGLPWESGMGPPNPVHPLYDGTGRLFYQITQNDKITSTPRPHNEDGYILISAGYDGLYGTRDDVYNFAD